MFSWVMYDVLPDISDSAANVQYYLQYIQISHAIATYRVHVESFIQKFRSKVHTRKNKERGSLSGKKNVSN